MLSVAELMCTEDKQQLSQQLARTALTLVGSSARTELHLAVSVNNSTDICCYDTQHI